MSWNTADVTLAEDLSTAHWVKERLLPVLPDEEGVKAGSIVPQDSTHTAASFTLHTVTSARYAGMRPFAGPRSPSRTD